MNLSAVIMAGGMGRRFGNPQKCLAPICGVPLLFRVAGALAQIADRIYVATTPRHGEVIKAAEKWGLQVIATPGLGYERDILHVVHLAPVVVAACDIANLAPPHVEALLGQKIFTTALSRGEPVGLSYIPNTDLERWTSVEVGRLVDVDTAEDLAEAEGLCPAAYPLYVDPEWLKPHEDVIEERVYEVVRPIAVDYRTGVILDGHHRHRFLKRARLPAPVLLFDYAVVDVNVDKGEVLDRAARGVVYPPKSTWHTYRGRHISEIPTVEVPVSELRRWAAQIT